MQTLKILAFTAVAGTAGFLGSKVVAYENPSSLHEAPVVSATPVYTNQKINDPVQQCWEEAVSTPQPANTSYTPEILGAIVGAGVGRFFGSGRGQDAATVAGAVLGGSIGHDVKVKRSGNNSQVRYEQRCKTVDQYRTEQIFEGYDVTYRYEDALYTTRTTRDPGETITLSVSAVPVEN